MFDTSSRITALFNKIPLMTGNDKSDGSLTGLQILQTKAEDATWPGSSSEGSAQGSLSRVL